MDYVSPSCNTTAETSLAHSLLGRLPDAPWRYQYALEQAGRLAATAGGEDISALLQSFSKVPSFEPYLRAPFFIMRQLERAAVPGCPADLLGASTLFFVWLKAVDEELDQRGESPARFLQLLQKGAVSSPEPPSPAERLSTKIGALTRANNGRFLCDMAHVAKAVWRERECRSMPELLRARENSGALTGLAMLRFIGGYSGPLKGLTRFFCRIGAVGNLADTVVDLKRDTASHELPFQPSANDQLLLYRHFFKGCIRLLKEYPALYREAAPLAFRLLRYRLTS